MPHNEVDRSTKSPNIPTPRRSPIIILRSLEFHLPRKTKVPRQFPSAVPLARKKTLQQRLLNFFSNKRAEKQKLRNGAESPWDIRLTFRPGSLGARTSGYIRFQLNVCSPDVESASGPSIIIVLAPRTTARTVPRRRTAAARGKRRRFFVFVDCLPRRKRKIGGRPFHGFGFSGSRCLFAARNICAALCPEIGAADQFSAIRPHARVIWRRSRRGYVVQLHRGFGQ